MNVHFIAIGGAAMHNLALALHHKGLTVTGSDDEINEPSRSRLATYRLLPEKIGWFPEKISTNLDAIILGMHARIDNPELLRAQQLGLPIFSYPEYIYEQSKNKKRIVIGGSHGKTTITSMIMHVLKKASKNFDYLVGSMITGFDTMVRLSDAPVIIIEGDEYLASPIDRRPKFHLYKADVGIISGIAWDHINVFPTFENYYEQFELFAKQIPADGKLIGCAEDEQVAQLMKSDAIHAMRITYNLPAYETEDDVTYIIYENIKYPISIFEKHNVINREAAILACAEAGIYTHEFYKLIADFTGAARRLELVGRKDDFVFYKDFAHAPSKVKATVDAVREQFPKHKLIACLELHTFSSLNKTFLLDYRGCLDNADTAVVYFNHHTIAHKKLEALSEEFVTTCFGGKVTVLTDSAMLKQMLLDAPKSNTVLLMMSSGTFDGINLNKLMDEFFEI
ncbi:MAG: peptidoglycan synthetase [Bacteroidetes bacterium]|nr:peptidoglycan synthetase [Bacteroidota bacterium]